jgi:hypothetical protein
MLRSGWILRKMNDCNQYITSLDGLNSSKRIKFSNSLYYSETAKYLTQTEASCQDVKIHYRGDYKVELWKANCINVPF